MEEKILTKVKILMKMELDELCELDMVTNNLSPILDPATIIVNIINKDDKEIWDNDILKKENNEISINSSLSNIVIIFFRHQHILKILKYNMDMLKLILDFSTSKVDIFINYLELLMKLVFLLGIFFVIRIQPIFIVRILIFITLLYSYSIYIVIGTYWFRYILIIVILRGVLVVFIYIVSLIPNEKFEIYNLLMLFLFIMVMIIKFDFHFVIDIRLITVNLWVTYLGIFNLFLVRFLLRVILLVIILRYISDGSFRVD